MDSKCGEGGVQVYLRGQPWPPVEVNDRVMESEDLDAALARVVQFHYNGERAFFGITGVPVDFLFAELRGGGSIDSFLENYPDLITRQQVDEVLRIVQKQFDRRKR